MGPDTRMCSMQAFSPGQSMPRVHALSFASASLLTSAALNVLGKHMGRFSGLGNVLFQWNFHESTCIHTAAHEYAPQFGFCCTSRSKPAAKGLSSKLLPDHKPHENTHVCGHVFGGEASARQPSLRCPTLGLLTSSARKPLKIPQGLETEQVRA